VASTETTRAWLAALDVPGGLLEKYDRPGPRYTSYPPAPFWTDHFDPEEFYQACRRADAAGTPVSLYVHIPFCESLCLFCACNVAIRKDRRVVEPYLNALREEMTSVAGFISRDRAVVQLHWGGGTPTYLSPAQMEHLFGDLQRRFRLADDAELGVEVDPRVTTPEHLETLRRLGFNRLSMGIQDFDPDVQQAVHRVQTFEQTQQIVQCARQLRFASINVDLMYGLPRQTVSGFSATLDHVLTLAPDRIALFSYAHVPWLRKQQGSFAHLLPSNREKFRIFRQAIERLLEAGYVYIGMDHFARPDDELARAQSQRTLHRNFQGYSTRAGADLYGLGASAISRVADVYVQNDRNVERYQERVRSTGWALIRGYRLSADDRIRGAVISRLLCHAFVSKAEMEEEFGIEFDRYFARELEALTELEQDGLVVHNKAEIAITPRGRIFMRNVAMVFDRYLQSAAAQPRFSRTL
jgi:oxygen-independent coproporphyrinogen-3 oxidase